MFGLVHTEAGELRGAGGELGPGLVEQRVVVDQRGNKRDRGDLSTDDHAGTDDRPDRLRTGDPRPEQTDRDR